MTLDAEVLIGMRLVIETLERGSVMDVPQVCTDFSGHISQQHFLGCARRLAQSAGSENHIDFEESGHD
jgi:hypothetical protein